ncbi:MAG: hypothetical protein NVS3B28_05730 [Candidatus Velthaea sp.]
MQAIHANETEIDRVNTATVGGESRFAPAGLIAAAGWPALLAVSIAGLTAGFFAWYALVSRAPHGAAFLNVTFMVALAGGLLTTLYSWHWYSRYFARRTSVSYATALRYDSAAWAMLVLMWIALLAPVGASATGRAIAIAVGLFAIAKIAIAAYFNRTVREVSITFLVTRVSIVVIAELAAIVIGQRPGTHYAASQNPVLAVWGRWDAEHYLNVARYGYSGTEVAFFPLYPVLIRMLGAITGNNVIAGLIVSNVASFFGLLFFYKLAEHQYNRHVAQRATFYVSIFPTAIFFTAVYTESLFFALTVASFYYIRERRWLTAGAIAFFASLTRVEGVLLAVPFLIEWLVTLFGSGRSISQAFSEAVKWPVDHLVRPIVGLALVPLGLAVYMGYLWVLRGDPLYFTHVQAHWGRHLAPPWVSFGHSFELIAHAHNPQVIAAQVLEIAFTVLMVAVLIAGWKRLRPSYLAYMAVSILIPMSTSSLMSMPRFALVLFPMFVMFGLWGGRPSANNAIVAFSLPLLGLFTVLFADWYWVA